MLNILSLLMLAFKLIPQVEAIYPQSGSGPQKVEAILTALSQMIDPADLPTFMQAVWPGIQKAISIVVDGYNLAGFFKKGTPATAAPTLNVAPSPAAS